MFAYYEFLGKGRTHNMDKLEGPLMAILDWSFEIPAIAGNHKKWQ